MFNRRSPTLLGHRISRRQTIAGSGALATIAAALRISPPIRAAHSDLATPEGETGMSYEIEGRLLEVCTCNVLCPCWVGEDPDGGTCDSILGWAVDTGNVEGVDVSGRVLALSVHIPGNVLAGNWSAVVYVDDQATKAQEDSLLKVFTGQLGGAIADLAGLIGEVIAVERAPMVFAVEGGEGTMTIGDFAELKLAPFQGATGKSTVLQETVFSTIPGSPAFVGKAEYFRRNETRHGLSNVDITGQNAIQGSFRFFA
jgi:hypothetical protein